MSAKKLIRFLSLITLIFSVCYTVDAANNSTPASRRYGTQTTGALTLSMDSGPITILSGGSPSTKGLNLSNPYWEMTLDTAGYSDYLYWFDTSPRDHERGEMLSGEWAVAIYYDGISTEPNAMWLTDEFIYPNWPTNSDFVILEDPNSWDDPCNPVMGYDTGYSSIGNGQVKVRIDYEVVDLGQQDPNTGEGGSPLAFRDSNGAPVFVNSERYVLLHTYTITNIDQNDIYNLEFYQMLCGLETEQSFYGTQFYNDPLSNYEPYNPVHTTGNFHYDITQWENNLNSIGFGSIVKPDCFDNGNYPISPEGKPERPGTHWDVEERNLNGEPNSSGNAGAMGWYLDSLEPNESVSLTMALMLGAVPIQSRLPVLTVVDDVNGGDCVGPGDIITYNICYDANGYGDTNVVIIDELPNDVHFVSATGDYELISGTVTWDIGTLDYNESNCVSLTVQVECAEPGSEIANCCEMTGNSITGIATACESTPVCSPSLSKTDDVNDGNCVGPSDEIVYNICYAANGYGDTNVVITDELPNEVNFVSATGDYELISGTVTWDIGTLDYNESGCVSLTVMVKDAEPGSIITNSCEMMGDCITDAVTAFENTPVCSPSLSKTDDVNDGNCVAPGDNITYYLCYAANGYSDTNVVITDELPNEVDFVAASGDYVHNSGTVTWNIGTLEPDESDCVTLTVRVKCAEPNSTITNQSSMTGDYISNITAVENTPVCSNYPTLTKQDDIPDGDFAYTDNYITYYLCYDANGYGDTNVVIVDELPPEVTFVSASGDYNQPDPNTVILYIGTLASDDSGCLTLQVRVKSSVAPDTTVTNQCWMAGDCIENIYAVENTIVCACPGSYADEIMSDSPALWLRFEQTPLEDSSGNNYWVESGETAIEKTRGSMGKAVRLQNGYIAAANQTYEPCLPTDYNHTYAFAPNDITFEFWLKTPQPDEVDDYAGLFWQSDDTQLYAPGMFRNNIFCEQRCALTYGNGYFNTAEDTWIPDANWHHFVIMYDELPGNRINVKLFRDKEKIEDDTFGPSDGCSGLVGPEQDHILIGAVGNREDYWNSYHQYIDEFAIYPGTLSHCRVATHYEAWKPKDCNELWDREMVETEADPIFIIIDNNRDCRIDLADFASLAQEWMSCNDPAIGSPDCPPNW